VPDLWENETRINRDGQYMTTLITESAIRLIEQSAAARRPFFVDVAYNAPHWPYQRPDRPSPPPGTGAHQLPQDDNTATRDDLKVMLEAVDHGVGQILRTLDRLGLTNNTIVIFTNDNGGEWLMNNGRLFNRKLTVWEGGIRVPALVKWPGRIRPGTVSDQATITLDWSASIVAAVGATVLRTMRASTSFRFSRAGSRRWSELCTGARSRATATSARCATATGSWSSTATTSCSTTCARTSANAKSCRGSVRTSRASSVRCSRLGRPT
jgi:arylsulfatase A-like enzyme